jgi:hypothetical protein
MAIPLVVAATEATDRCECATHFNITGMVSEISSPRSVSRSEGGNENGRKEEGCKEASREEGREEEEVITSSFLR